MIYRARFVVPITGEPIENGEVLIRDGRIEAVGRRLASSAPGEEVEDLGNAAIMPGFVNAHSHLDYTVMRGLADNKPFLPWILTLIRYGARFKDEDFLASARLGALQMVRSGVTTIADASYSGMVVRAAAEAGLRGVVCQETFGGDPSEGYSDEMVDRVGRLREKAGDRIVIGISPHSPYTSSEARLREIAEFARAQALPVIIHTAETQDEIECVRNAAGPLARFGRRVGVRFRATGKTPVEYLKDIGILGESTVAAHCVWVTEGDIEILAETRTGVAHCPRSNAKLAGGVAPFARMLDRGVRAGLGTDSAVSGDPLDMFEEMRFALLMQRTEARDVRAMDSQRVLEAATLGGARALGLHSLVGSLEPGKRADMIAAYLGGPATLPAGDPYSALVYSCSAANIVLTMVDGEIIYRSGRLARVDPEEVMQLAARAAAKLRARPMQHYMKTFFGSRRR